MAIHPTQSDSGWHTIKPTMKTIYKGHLKQLIINLKTRCFLSYEWDEVEHQLQREPSAFWCSTSWFLGKKTKSRDQLDVPEAWRRPDFYFLPYIHLSITTWTLFLTSCLSASFLTALGNQTGDYLKRSCKAV